LFNHALDGELDLTNYQNAAAVFNFRNLIRSDAGGCSAVSAPDVPFEADLYAPRSGVRGRNQSRGSALFNLSAYDGQTVLLTVNYDRRSSILRRGYINVDNLRIDVASTQNAAATIPEPSTIFLIGAAMLAGLGFSASTRHR
jgi:hypothetical protein